MAKKTVLVSDMDETEIPEGTGATVTITFQDSAKGVKQLHVTDEQAEKFGGRVVPRRGRPKTETKANKK